MTRSWTRLHPIVAALALALVSGCAATATQCGPCPSSGFVEVQAGRQPAGTTVRLCIAQLTCTEQAFPSESADPADPVRLEESVRLQHLEDLEHETLGGLELTATLTPPPRTQLPPQTVHATTRYTDGGDGTCACSYLSADTITFEPAR